MTDARFWSIIDETVALETDPDAQIDALRNALSLMSADEVVGFRDAFERQMQRAYQWDLWAVAYIAHGGASDDGFEYFRRWLISKGRVAYERILITPDSLADSVPEDSEGPLEFEAISRVADEVWSDKSGKDLDDMPPPVSWTLPGAEPSGQPFSEDPAVLAARFPKMWARFGETPLG